MTTSNKPKFKLVGISGTNGAGKDTLAKILVDEYNYFFVSVTDILRNTLISQSVTPERKNLRALSISLRQEKGLAVLIDMAIDVYKSQSKTYQGLAVSSLRNKGESEEIHHLGGVVVWLDADPNIRYDRIQQTDANRSLSQKVADNKTYEQFIKEENDEMYPDPSVSAAVGLSMIDVKKQADYFIDNSLNSLDFLKEEVKKIFN